MITQDVKDCKLLALTNKTNKIVAAVHEMGHYLVATHTTKSTILTVTANYIEWLTNSNGKWYGHTNIAYTPIPPTTLNSTTFELEHSIKLIAIGYAGKFAEIAMFGQYDHTGYTMDLQMVHRAQSYIIKNAPNFGIEAYTTDVLSKLTIFMQTNLDKIARNALKMYNTKQCPIKFTANDIV